MQSPTGDTSARLLPTAGAGATSAARRAQEECREEIPESGVWAVLTGTNGRTWALSAGIFGKQSQTGRWTAEN